MELPKNITQVGEWSTSDRIYVEDYVVSYMKQMRAASMEKEMAIALYGIRKSEEDKTYLFVYGAGKLDFLQRETRHLSQAQKQEIEKLRIKYFSDYVFLGYGILDGEPVEGFFVSDQEVCRFSKGYAQFYEKNDAMLAYMLEEREEEVVPEVVNREKYEAVKQKQEQRVARGVVKEADKPKDKRFYKKSIAFVSGMGAVYLLYISSGLKWDNFAQGLGERKLPVDSGQIEVAVQPEDEEKSFTASDELVIKENGKKKSNGAENERKSKESKNVEGETEEKETEKEGAEKEGAEKEEKEKAEKEKTEKEESGIAEEKETETYIIKKGDTLSAISFFTYGTDRRVEDICKINSIINPDEIKIGQKILLP